MTCNDQLLVQLINESLSEPRTDDVTRHVDQCCHCQKRLLQLAADQDSWDEISAALSQTDELSHGSIVITMDSELSADMPLQADSISVDFLDAPRHPEMLGRIGRYDVERLIGAGGMGIVFKAFDTELHRPVAIKVLAPHLAHSGAARQRFAREAQSAAAVVHNNVVPIHNVDVTGTLPFLVMQFVSGESLQSRVDRDGPLGIREVLRIGVQVADGLAAAHETGLVHRDVKPGNILMGDHVDRVLISDFGLARAADDACATRSGLIAGTPHYMSPEQARGDTIDARSDLFSLGGVLYFMCTGRPPFRADGAMAVLNRICHDRHTAVDEVNDQVPAGLADLIDRLLQKSPDRRPGSATEVNEQLTRFIQSNRVTYRRKHAPRLQRRRVAEFVVGILATVAVVGLVVEMSQRNPGGPTTGLNAPNHEDAKPEANPLVAAIIEDGDLRRQYPDSASDVARPQSAAYVQHEPTPLAGVNQAGHIEAEIVDEADVALAWNWSDTWLPRELDTISAELRQLEHIAPATSLPTQTGEDDWELAALSRGMDAMEEGVFEIVWPDADVE